MYLYQPVFLNLHTLIHTFLHTSVWFLYKRSLLWLFREKSLLTGTGGGGWKTRSSYLKNTGGLTVLGVVLQDAICNLVFCLCFVLFLAIREQSSAFFQWLLKTSRRDLVHCSQRLIVSIIKPKDFFLSSLFTHSFNKYLLTTYSMQSSGPSIRQNYLYFIDSKTCIFQHLMSLNSGCFHGIAFFFLSSTKNNSMSYNQWPFRFDGIPHCPWPVCFHQKKEYAK